MADPLATPGAAPQKPLRMDREVVMSIPVTMLRYRQRPLESGRGRAPDRVDGRGIPQDHVIHRTLPF